LAAALGRLGHDLGRVDLGEVQRPQRGAKTVQRGRGQPEQRAAARVAQRQRGMVQDRRQLRLERGPE